jgi:hypothetical protein
MSVYPSAPDIFVDRTGADAISSSDPNNAYDAIENIENFLGASGESQAKSVTLMNAFRAMFSPLPACTWMDADTIGILPSQGVLFSTDRFVIKRNTSVLTCHLSTDLDTGSEIASKWYDLYLVGDGASSQYTAKFALQGSTPTGVSYFKKINSFFNDAGSNLLRAYQSGNYMEWDTAVVVSTTPSVAAWSAAISCTNAIPAISTLAKFALLVTGSGAPIAIWIKPNGAVASSNPQDALYLDIASTIAGSKMRCTDGSQQIQIFNAGNTTASTVSVEGYFLNIS